MKWYQIILMAIYVIPGLVFLYFGVIHTYVYFANKSLGYQESFLTAGRNLALGAFLCGMAGYAWYIYKGGLTSGPLYYLTFLPLALMILLGLWTIFILLSAGGKWN